MRKYLVGFLLLICVSIMISCGKKANDVSVEDLQAQIDSLQKQLDESKSTSDAQDHSTDKYNDTSNNNNNEINTTVDDEFTWVHDDGEDAAVFDDDQTTHSRVSDEMLQARFQDGLIQIDDMIFRGSDNLTGDDIYNFFSQNDRYTIKCNTNADSDSLENPDYMSNAYVDYHGYIYIYVHQTPYLSFELISSNYHHLLGESKLNGITIRDAAKPNVWFAYGIRADGKFSDGSPVSYSNFLLPIIGEANEDGSLYTAINGKLMSFFSSTGSGIAEYKYEVDYTYDQLTYLDLIEY